jgi:hypothetical protein
MSYSDDQIVNVCLGNWDFGDGNTVDIQSWRLPPGFKGEVIAVGVSITETVNALTTAPTVKVGTAANDDAYALLTIPNGTADKDFFDQTDDTDAIIAAASGQDAQIPAGTLVQFTGTQAATSGTAAGKGNVIVTFRLWK